MKSAEPTVTDGAAGGARLDGRHAWITGAGRGIGRSCALALARLGASVHLISRTVGELDVVAAEARDLGATAVSHAVDVTDGGRVEAAFRGATVDILINAAGVNIPTAFVDVTEEIYDRVMDLNTKALLFVSQHAVRRMVAGGRGGAIVNVTSQMAHVGGPDRAVYCASKAAVAGMTKALAVELATDGIRVNCVAPTFVETAMTASFLAEPSFRTWALAQIPLGRFGTPDEVADAVAFLAGPQSGLITGVSLLVDGGWTAR